MVAPKSTDADVIVVGAGPVGLTVALALVRREVRVVVLEADAGPGRQWRASTFHPPTLDVAADLGIADSMLGQGLTAPVYQLRDHEGGPVVRFDLGALADETAWPFRLQLEQYKYAAIIEEHLMGHRDAEIRFGARVSRVESDGDGVAVFVDGSAAPLRSRLLVAGDGSTSSVREQAGIPFEGFTYPVRRLLLSLDVPLQDHVADLDLVNYVYSPGGPGMVLRIPDVWRVMFTVPDGVSDETARTPGYYSRRLDQLLGIDVPVLTTTVYHVHQRVAASFRRGPILLTGDAAHINSPTGGMGLNSGIHDAFDLAATVAASMPRRLDEALDAWATRRRDVALDDVQRVTHRTTADLGETDDRERRRKQDEMRAIRRDPRRTKDWLMETSMIASTRRVPVGAARTAPRSQAHDVAASPRALAGGVR